MMSFVLGFTVVIPGLEVFEVVQDVSSEWLQHVSLHVVSWKQGQHLDGQVCGLPMHIHRELSSRIGAIAGQHDLGVPP